MSALCGIVDFAGNPVSPLLLRRMAAASDRTEPGRPACRFLGDAALAHRALAAGGEEQLAGDPQRGVYLTADARLDNREELSGILASRGLPAPGASGDAALILWAYLLWGEECVERLLGDFAFALWDARDRRLLCARDPLGIKPLCYARAGSALCFASEARQILEHPAVSRSLDELALGEYLAGGREDPARTFFRDIRPVPPGHRMIAARDSLRLRSYWEIGAIRPDRETDRWHEEDWAACFRERFERAVADRLRGAGEAVAVALSGGLDSGSVAAVARRRLPLPGGPSRLVACSMVFDRLRECDEGPYIRSIAEEIGCELASVEAERHWFLGDRDAYRPGLESPFLAWDSCFREMLARARERGARVLLTGYGGDELLAGSRRIYADRLRNGDLTALAPVLRCALTRGRSWWRVLYACFGEPLLPPSLNRSLRRLTGRAAHSGVPLWIHQDLVRKAGLQKALQADGRMQGSARREIVEAVASLCADPAFGWFDRHAARFGMEVRHPFLDRRLVELAVSIPPERLFRLDQSKPLLRRAMAGILPEPVRTRCDKTRLGAFINFALREKEVVQIRRLLASPLVAELGLVNAAVLRRAYESYLRRGPQELDRAIWYALALEIWLQNHRGTLGITPVGHEMGTHAAA